MAAFRPTAIVSIYAESVSGSQFDADGDPEEGFTLRASGVKAAFGERSQRVQLPNSSTPSTIRRRRLLLPRGTQVSKSDRVVDDQGQRWMVVHVFPVQRGAPRETGLVRCDVEQVDAS